MDFPFEAKPAPQGTRFREIRTFPLLDSTNRYLRDEFAAGESEGLVAIADDQTEGRGRHGRKWDSKPGTALLLSVLLTPPDVASAQRMTNAMALAITDACKFIGGFPAQLKWPNDVMVDGKKLAGVLAELVDVPDSSPAVIIGAGVNLNWGNSFPASLKQTATSVDVIAKTPINRDEFVEAFLRAFHERLARPSWLAQAYRERCATIGQNVKVSVFDDEFVGVAKDVDNDGALIVQLDNGDTRTLTAGDVTHLRLSAESQ